MDNKRNLTIFTAGNPNVMLKQLAAHIAYYAIVDYQSSVGEYKLMIENDIYSKWFQGVILPILDISMDEFEKMLDSGTKSLWIDCKYTQKEILEYLEKHCVRETANHFNVKEDTLQKSLSRAGVNLGEIANRRKTKAQLTFNF